MGANFSGSGGAFTAADQASLAQAFTQINADFYVDGNNGFNGNPGTSQGLAFRTMSGTTQALLAAKFLRPSWPITIAVAGVLQEEYSSPKVNQVRVVGAQGYPVQATTSGVANGGGATWLSPSSGTGALFQPNGQGWILENMFLNNSATAAGCVKLVNAGDPPLSNCSESFILRGCRLTGADDGVAALDLPNHVLIEKCQFFGFSGAGDLGISSATGAGTGTLLNWTIQDCDFLGNTGHITAGFSGATIRRNRFSYIWNGVTTTTQVILTGGANNSVHGNYMDIPYTTNGISQMFLLGTNDRWYDNRFATAVTTTIFSFGAPVS